jgi:hypothetical protein
MLRRRIVGVSGDASMFNAHLTICLKTVINAISNDVLRCISFI